MANERKIVGFDTLAAAHALEEAGVERQQAEAHAKVIAAAIAGGGPATKADIVELETRRKADRAEFEARMTVRLYGGLAALGLSLAALVAGLKLFG